MTSYKHQLAAIMFTDIVGYTSMMRRDENRALEILQKNRLIQKPSIEKYNGTLIKEMGDGILASFDSAYEAVKCAIEIQEKATKGFKGQLRIGLHLGEIFVENGDIFGDGVNIASRIESIADPGGIYLSGAFQKSLKSRLDIHTQYLGRVALKNVDDPVEIYYLTGKYLSIPAKKKISRIRNTGVNEKVFASRFFKNPIFYILLAMLLVLVLSFQYWFETTPERRIKSLAVLPFVNLTGDSDSQPIVDMMHDAVIGEISKISGIRVISRHSTLQFRDTELSVPEIARILNVDALIEASVHNVGDTAFIQVQLVQARPIESHILSESFERDIKHVRALYGDLAKLVAQKVQIQLSPAEKEGLTHSGEIDPLVYKAYLQGQYFLLNLSKDGIEKSKEYFERVLEMAPDHALAHAGLASYYVAYAQQGHVSFFEAGPLADYHAKKALELSDQFPEVYQAAAFNAFLQWEFDDYLKFYRKALELNPNFSEVLAFMGQALVMEGMPEEALEKVRKATELDPLNDTFQALYTMCLYFTGKYDESYDFVTKALQSDPDHVMLNSSLRAVYHAKKMYEEEYQSWIKKYVQTKDTVAVNALKSGYESGGYKIALENLIDHLIRQFKYSPDYIPAWQIATLYARIDQKEETLFWLEKAYDLHSISLPFILIDPLFDNMRDDQRFLDLVAKMNLKRE